MSWLAIACVISFALVLFASPFARGPDAGAGRPPTPDFRVPIPGPPPQPAPPTPTKRKQPSKAPAARR